MVEGDEQSSLPGEALPKPLRVRLIGSNDRPFRRAFVQSRMRVVPR